jgi:hypothetical protein
MAWNSSNWNATNWDNSYWIRPSTGGGNSIVVATLSAATGYTHVPTASISVYINLCSYNSSLPYNSSEIYNCFNGSTASLYTNPITIRNIFEVGTSIATLVTYTPTLNNGSTVYIAVNSSAATGFTYRPRFGTIGLGPDYTGTSDILDSYPSLRKGILNSNSNPVTVIAGQVGLPNGAVLIHLGNGQWIIRK